MTLLGNVAQCELLDLIDSVSVISLYWYIFLPKITSLTLLSEALYLELDFLKKRIKKVELLISKIVEEAAKEKNERK